MEIEINKQAHVASKGPRFEVIITYRAIDTGELFSERVIISLSTLTYTAKLKSLIFALECCKELYSEHGKTIEDSYEGFLEFDAFFIGPNSIYTQEERNKINPFSIYLQIPYSSEGNETCIARYHTLFYDSNENIFGVNTYFDEKDLDRIENAKIRYKKQMT
jgi:hypothetical protein